MWARSDTPHFVSCFKRQVCGSVRLLKARELHGADVPPYTGIMKLLTLRFNVTCLVTITMLVCVGAVLLEVFSVLYHGPFYCSLTLVYMKALKKCNNCSYETYRHYLSFVTAGAQQYSVVPFASLNHVCLMLHKKNKDLFL